MTKESLLQFLKNYIQDKLREQLYLYDEKGKFYHLQGIMHLSFGDWRSNPELEKGITPKSLVFSTSNGRLDIIIDATQPNRIHSNRFTLKTNNLEVEILTEENKFKIKEDLKWEDFISFDRV